MSSSGEIRYLGLAEVIGLHALVMERSGYHPAPLRDEALLESALMRPRMAAHYAGADLLRQAAWLAAGIAQAQAFLDGNKRTAFATADVFLRINGSALRGDPLVFAQLLESLATREGSLDQAAERLLEWMRSQE